MSLFTDLKEVLTPYANRIKGLSADLDNLEPGLSDAAKMALLDCFQHVAWVDGEAQELLINLEEALYTDGYPRLSVIFNPDKVKIYDDFTEQDIRNLLTVRYYRAAGDYDIVTNYTLSYSLATATTQILISYNGLSRSVTTNVVIGRPLTSSDIESHIGYVNFAVDENGNISCSDTTGFSAIVLNSSIKHIRLTPSYTDINSRRDPAAWAVYHKESGTVVYVSSATHSFVFTSDGSKYAAQQDDTKSTITISNNDLFLADTRKDIILEDGILTVSEALNLSAYYKMTNANVIGVWTDARQDSAPKQVRVYSE